MCQRRRWHDTYHPIHRYCSKSIYGRVPINTTNTSVCSRSSLHQTGRGLPTRREARGRLPAIIPFICTQLHRLCSRSITSRTRWSQRSGSSLFVRRPGMRDSGEYCHSLPPNNLCRPPSHRHERASSAEMSKHLSFCTLPPSCSVAELHVYGPAKARSDLHTLKK